MGLATTTNVVECQELDRSFATAGTLSAVVVERHLFVTLARDSCPHSRLMCRELRSVFRMVWAIAAHTDCAVAVHTQHPESFRKSVLNQPSIDRTTVADLFAVFPTAAPDVVDRELREVVPPTTRAPPPIMCDGLALVLSSFLLGPLVVEVDVFPAVDVPRLSPLVAHHTRFRGLAVVVQLLVVTKFPCTAALPRELGATTARA